MSTVADKTRAAREAKNNLDTLIDAAKRNPVAIKRRGRTVAYVVSPVSMEALEDFDLGRRAMEVIKRGKFLGTEETKKFFDSILHDA